MAGEDVFVTVGADTTSYRRAMDDMRRSMGAVNEATRQMQKQLAEATRAQDMAMMDLKQKAMESELAWFQMGQSMGNYTGSSKQFMQAVVAQGKVDKQVKDQMMARDKLAVAGFVQGVGTMLNASGQTSKIADNYTRMGNPLLTVNNNALKVAGGLEAMARAGQPAVIALKQLGPNANMKQLNDHVMMITQGLTRFSAVAMASGVATVLMVGGLHKASMENENYAKSYNTMLSTLREALQPMVDVFTMVMTKVYDFVTAVGKLVIKFNEAHPTLAKFIQGFLMLIPILTLILSPLAVGIGLFAGMQAVWAMLAPLIMPLVTGLAAMSSTVLIVAGVIVGLIAVGVLLYKNWDTIKAKSIEVWNAVKNACIQAWEGIKSGLSSAWSAIVSALTATWQAIVTVSTTVWNAVKTGIMTAVSGIASFLSSVWQGIVTVATTVWNAVSTAIMTAVTGIGSFLSGAWSAIVSGISSAWNGVSSFFSSMWNGIKAIFTGAIAGVISIAQTLVSFFLNYTPLGIVVQTIIKNWNTIKQTFQITGQMIVALWQVAWNAIKSFVGTILSGIVSVITTAWNGIKTVTSTVMNGVKSVFTTVWNSLKGVVVPIVNGIKSAVTTAWNGIKSVTSSVFNAVKSVATSVWNSLKSVIGSAVNGVKSVVTTAWNGIKSVTSSVFNSVKSVATTAWNGVKSVITTVVNGVKSVVTTAWNGIKSVTSSAFNGVKSVATSVFNSIKSTISSIANSIKSVVTTAWNGIKSVTSSIFNSVKSVVSSVFNSIKSTISSIVNGIKSTVSSAFNAVKNAMVKPIQEAKALISSALSAIKSLFSGLKLTIPKPKIPKISVSAGSKSVGGVNIPYPKFNVGWYAKGGVFNGASVIGVGERGTEAVVPLQGSRMKPFAEEIAGQMPQTNGGGGNPVQVNTVIELDGREIARATSVHMDNELRRKTDSKSRAGGRN